MFFKWLTTEEYYKFDYGFQMRGSSIQANFSNRDSSEQKMKDRRIEILESFRRALREEINVEVDDGLVIRGNDLAWFWVGEVRWQII